MSEFIVEGRRFKRRLHAVEFALQLAFKSDRSVDVKVETTDLLYRKHMTWMCRMHPPNIQRTVLKTAPFVPQVHAVAV